MFFVISLLALSAGLVPAVSAQELDSIAEEIDQTGVFSQKELTPPVVEAIDRANDRGVGFLWLDEENSDRDVLAGLVLERLAALDSDLRSLIVLDNSGVWVQSLDDAAAARNAADASTAAFARSAVAEGIDTAVAVLGGETVGTASGGGSATAPEPDSGGGVPWLWIIVLGVIAFFAIRWLTGRRRTAAALDKAMADDRAEIREQLKNNADFVIDLGAKIATADDDLRRMYEEAAQTYQDVSLGLDDAATPAEIDALDDRLDRAEWQFQVIDARLEGRTPPPEPNWDEPPPPTGRPTSLPGPGPTRPDGRQPVPPLGGAPDTPADSPALGDDDSIFGGRGPRRRTQPRAPRGSTGGGMIGGLVKSGLGALLLKMLLGGGLSAGSRRSQRRQQTGGYDGGIGGGVLR